MDTATVLPTPMPLGLQPSFGFGDRLGLATPGHLDAARRGSLLPIFAQQSVREMSRTNREPAEVMQAAQAALTAEEYEGPWGADADHLKTREDVFRLAAAGFTFYTIDPSDHVNNRADELVGDELRDAAEAVVTAGAFESLAEVEGLYLGRVFDVPGAGRLGFEEREPLYRAVAKYGAAVAHAARMAEWIAAAAPPFGAEIELSVDETATPTRLEEHLFVGLELRRRGVEVISLAPRFVGEFEKGVDYRGDLREFEASLRSHVAVARYCGPYKISVHSGSDKFSIYPVLGRVCGDLLHVKTAGTSYLEALRVAARTAPALFADIVSFARSRFERDRATYHISARLDTVPPIEALAEPERERVYLDQDGGRQILHVTFGSVLTEGRGADGRSFKEALLEVLQDQQELHRQLVAAHLGRHIELLQAG